MLIGAYYYGWYKHDWLKQTVRGSDPPCLGEYDNTVYSSDGTCRIIESQMRGALAAGIDFFPISWKGEDHSHILESAARTGMKVTYLYESFVHANKSARITAASLPAILQDISQLKDEMAEEHWLRVDGKPVLMFYVTRCFDDVEEIFGAIRKAIPEAYLVGDELFWAEADDRRIATFDAVTYYNMYEPCKFKVGSDEETMKSYLSAVDETMSGHSKQCRRLGVPLWGNAMPGYDDRGIRPGDKHPPISRLDGNFFKTSLMDAMMVSDGALVVTSYNEHYEDTQIEPCQSYGNKYLDILRRFKEAL